MRKERVHESTKGYLVVLELAWSLRRRKYAVKQYINRLKYESGFRRFAAASMLERLAEPATASPKLIDTLIESLKDRDHYIQYFGAKALGKLGKKAEKAIPILKDLHQKSRHSNVSSAAARAIWRIETAGGQVLKKPVRRVSKKQVVKRRVGRKAKTISLTERSKNYLEQNCRICNTELRVKQSVSICPYCKALYHRNHLEQWLRNNIICTVCKKEIELKN